jgi:MFS transporter, ACS family, D-galactonate transporter
MGRLQLHFLSLADLAAQLSFCFSSCWICCTPFFTPACPGCLPPFTDVLVGGWLVDALIQRGCERKRVRQTVMVAGWLLGWRSSAQPALTAPVAALVWISLALGGLAAAAPVAWTVPSLISPRESVGTLASAVNFCGQLAAISAPIVTGYIVSGTHSFAAAFLTAALPFLLLGIVGLHFLLGRIEAIPEPETASGMR